MYFEKPSFVPNRCTHTDVNSNSEHVVKYCSTAKTKDECEDSGTGSSWRALHCKWNINKYEMTFDEDIKNAGKDADV